MEQEIALLETSSYLVPPSELAFPAILLAGEEDVVSEERHLGARSKREERQRGLGEVGVVFWSVVRTLERKEMMWGT